MSGPETYPARICQASRRSAGVKSIRSSTETPCCSNGGGLVGEGWVDEYHSPGTLPPGTERSSIGQTGAPVTRSNTQVKPCLLTMATALMSRPATVRSTRLGAAGKS